MPLDTSRTSTTPKPRRATPRGLIDHLRAVEGTEARGALVRDRIGDGSGDGAPKVSLRSASGRSTSRPSPRRGRRRPPPGGGLHDGAVDHDELVAFLREQIAAQLLAGARTSCGRRRARRGADGVLWSTSPPARPRTTSSRRSGARCRGARSATPARSTRSRPGCCSCSSGARRACSASSWRYRRPTRRSRGWRDVDTGDPEGEIIDTGPPARPLSCRPAWCSSARRPTGRQGGRPARVRERPAGERWSPRARGDRIPLRAAVARRRPRGVRDRLLVGHLCRTLIADLGDAYCEELRRPRSAVPRRATPTRARRPLARRCRSCRPWSSSRPTRLARGARRRGRGRGGAEAGPARRSRRPVAVAEPRDGGREARRRLPR